MSSVSDMMRKEEKMKEVFIISISMESPYDPNAILQEHIDSVFSSEDLANEYVKQLIERERNKHHTYCLKRLDTMGTHKYLGQDDPKYGSFVHYDTYDFKTVAQINFLFHGRDIEGSIYISITKMKVRNKI